MNKSIEIVYLNAFLLTFSTPLTCSTPFVIMSNTQAAKCKINISHCTKGINISSIFTTQSVMVLHRRHAKRQSEAQRAT